VGDEVYIKDKNPPVHGKITERKKATDGSWLYTVKDSQGNIIKDIPETGLE
jgi:hypothetical protein